MAMVYQKGSVYEKGTRMKKWYGKFRVYMRDREGKEVTRTKRVILGLKSKLRKHEAEERLQEIIQRRKRNRKECAVSVLKSDDSVTFDWFVSERYLPMRWGEWRLATKVKQNMRSRNTWSQTQRYAFEENWDLRNPDAVERSGSGVFRIDRQARVCKRTVDYANGTEVEVYCGEPRRGHEKCQKRGL